MLENTLLVGFLGREADGFDAAARDAHHFTGLDFADILSIEEIESAGLRRDEPGIAKFAEIERAEASGIAHGVEFVGREYEGGVGAFHLIESVAQCSGEIARLRSR